MGSYRFFRNEDCEFFPCHNIEYEENREDFNCLFCYCPLYTLGEVCGGEYVYTENGIKDCTGCSIPHRKDSYEYITGRWKELAEMACRKQKSEYEE